MSDLLNSLNPIAEAIIRWGPAGIAAILMLFAERRLKERWQDAPDNAGSSIKWLYIGNWLFIAVMLSIVAVMWVQRETDTNDGIASRGSISNVPEHVTLHADPRIKLYQRLVNNTFSDDDEIEWHFLKDTGQERREFRVQSVSANGSKTTLKYQLPEDLDYRNPEFIELEYSEHPNGTFVLSYHNSNKGLTTLKPVPTGRNAIATTETDTFISLFIRDAHAQDVTFEMITRSLDSKNPYKREDAAKYLSEHQTDYAAEIDASLREGSLSENQLWGVLYALDPARIDADSLPETTRQSFFKALFHQSPEISRIAEKLFLNTMTAGSLKSLKQKCGQPEVIDDAFVRERCAYLVMASYYHLGITSVTQQENPSIQTIIDAITLMEPGTELAQYASPNQQIHHGKILYGLGLSFEKLAQAYEASDMTEEAGKAQNNAEIYFNNFLTFLADHPSETEIYSYCWHLHQAECYIDTPSQQCIDDNPVVDCDYAALLAEPSNQAPLQKEQADKETAAPVIANDKSKPPIFIKKEDQEK